MDPGPDLYAKLLKGMNRYESRYVYTKWYIITFNISKLVNLKLYAIKYLTRASRT